MMTKNQEFANKLNDTVTKLNSVLTQVDTGQGTIGKLLKDPSLYNHTDQMISNTSEFITALRKDPKKYLTIHMKVF
jgi:phospholipid/cholesterol/gamma-HCH transport system substrate-binding protein